MNAVAEKVAPVVSPMAKTNCGCAHDCDEPISKIAVWTGDKDGKPVFEALCPRAFAFDYAPRHPEQFTPGTYIAARCSLCGVLQVLTPGSPSCIQCKGHLASMQPEKP